MIKNLLFAAACLLVTCGLQACETAPDGQVDCTKAPQQRAAIQAGVVAAQVAHDAAYSLCKVGDEGNKCRKTADQIQLGANAAAQIALIVLDSRCPPLISGPPGQ